MKGGGRMETGDEEWNWMGDELKNARSRRID